MTARSLATTGTLLAAALRAGGIDAVYGDPIAGIDVVPVPSQALAALLSTTHHRLSGRRALVSVGRSLRAAGPNPRHIGAGSVAAIAALPPAIAGGISTGFTIDLDLDLAAPAAGLVLEPVTPADGWGAAPDGLADQIAAAASPLVLAGPGVVRAGAVPGLHALAAAGRLGVLNTWGAKGVFDWRSRHHLATVGLQQLDFELGGVRAADLVIAVGLDADEAPDAIWRRGSSSVVVEPASLSATAELLSRVGPWLPVPEIRHRLAAVTQQGWADAGRPLAPTAATRNYSAMLGGGGRVAADAGLAGFWVARTFTTTELGSAQVPATVIPGFAAAAALVSRLLAPGRAVLAVVNGPPSDPTYQLLELADSLGRGFAVESWAADGEPLDAETHLARLGPLAVASRSEIVSVATAGWQLERIVDAAGPVVAWGGLPAAAG